MERVPVRSKAIAQVGYEGSTLEIEFTSGSVYRYFDVAERLHQDLLRAESHGKFFAAHVRGKFRYARV
jgi:hypothetical protein